MSGHYTAREAETIRSFVRGRRNGRKEFLADRLAAARRDCDAIILQITERHSPRRVYLWGSLVNDRHFSEMSDIDIALEGITDPVELSSIRADAEKLTQFPLDIVTLEHMHPAYADFIRRRGRIVHG